MTELIFFDRHTKLTPLISCFNSFVISIWDTFLKLSPFPQNGVTRKFCLPW